MRNRLPANNFRCGRIRSGLRSIVAASIVLWLGLAPAVALAGHGVEDSVDNLPAERVKQLLDAGEKILFVDLRTAQDFQKSRLPGARSIPVAELPKRYGEVPKTGRVVLYCDCKHAEVADRAIFLEYRGNRNIFVMPEGYAGWVRRGYPLEK
jgi:rhodanese-related sulfurtransferase